MATICYNHRVFGPLLGSRVSVEFVFDFAEAGLVDRGSSFCLEIDLVDRCRFKAQCLMAFYLSSLQHLRTVCLFGHPVNSFGFGFCLSRLGGRVRAVFIDLVQLTCVWRFVLAVYLLPLNVGSDG